MKNKIRKALLSLTDSLAGKRVLVACSGGADSTALCHLLLSLCAELQSELIIAHYNHAIRGKEAERDEAFVRRLAADWGLKLCAERMDWQGQNLSEERARTARYDFLRRMAQEHRARWVALGHTGEDLAETLLLNLLRGGGSAGLKGIPFVREGIFIRPLLRTSRAEILAYLRKHQIAFMEDSSNADTQYLRNKIRHELLPLLEREYNPRVRIHLRRTAEILAMENDYLNQEAQGFLEEHLHNKARVAAGIGARGEGVVLCIEELQALHPALGARVLGKALQSVTGLKGGVYYEHIQSLWRLLKKKEGSQEAHLPQGVRASREYGRLFLEKGNTQARERLAFSITVPSQVEVAGMRLCFSHAPAGKARFDNPDVVFLDSDKIAFPLLLRNWQAGDTIKPLGMNGKSRKLQDIFTDKKVPTAQRGRLPLLVDANEVLWVPGVVFSESVRLTEQTRRTLRVEITGN